MANKKERLSDSEILEGIKNNNRTLLESQANHLAWIYERVFPEKGMARLIVNLPKSAIEYFLESIIIKIPDNPELGNFHFVIYSNAQGLSYVSNNLRSDNLGASIPNFTSPGASGSFEGMVPIELMFKGTETVTIDFRGKGLGNLAYIDVLLLGRQRGRWNPLRGFDVDI